MEILYILPSGATSTSSIVDLGRPGMLDAPLNFTVCWQSDAPGSRALRIGSLSLHGPFAPAIYSEVDVNYSDSDTANLSDANLFDKPGTRGELINFAMRCTMGLPCEIDVKGVFDETSQPGIGVFDGDRCDGPVSNLVLVETEWDLVGNVSQGCLLRLFFPEGDCVPQTPPIRRPEGLLLG